jgi:hypothetical protein
VPYSAIVRQLFECVVGACRLKMKPKQEASNGRSQRSLLFAFWGLLSPYFARFSSLKLETERFYGVTSMESRDVTSLKIMHFTALAVRPPPFMQKSPSYFKYNWNCDCHLNRNSRIPQNILSHVGVTIGGVWIHIVIGVNELLQLVITCEDYVPTVLNCSKITRAQDEVI